MYDEYLQRIRKGESAQKVMDALGIERYCCRRTIFSHVDLMDEMLKFPRQ